MCRPSDLGPGESEAWARLQLALGCSNPFLSYNFALAVERCRASTRVAILEDGNKVVGFLPFDRGWGGIGRPLAPGMSDCQALVASPELTVPMSALLRSCGLTSLELDHCLAASAIAHDLSGSEKPSAVVSVAEGYSSYFAARKRRGFFKTVAYKRRKFERDFGPLRFAFGNAVHGDVATLLRWKSEQYRRTGRRDRFAQKWIVELIEQVAAMDSDEASGVFCGLYLGERLVAGEFSIASRDYFSSWLPSYDIEFARYSPGSIATLLVLEGAAAAGMSQVDLGKGDEPYKANYKTHEIALVDGYARRQSVVGLGWAAQRAARTYPMDFVLSRPTLRAAARKALARGGRLRPGTHRGLPRLRTDPGVGSSPFAATCPERGTAAQRPSGFEHGPAGH